MTRGHRGPIVDKLTNNAVMFFVQILSDLLKTGSHPTGRTEGRVAVAGCNRLNLEPYMARRHFPLGDMPTCALPPSTSAWRTLL